MEDWWAERIGKLVWVRFLWGIPTEAWWAKRVATIRGPRVVLETIPLLDEPTVLWEVKMSDLEGRDFSSDLGADLEGSPH